MRTVKFKTPFTSLAVPGIGNVDDSNITPDLYDRLLKISPSHADLFVVTNEETKQPAKPKSDDTKA